MPHRPTVSEETAFGFPVRLPDQRAVLIGRITGDSEFSGFAAYYIHGAGDVAVGAYHDGEFVPRYTIECESRLMSACVRAFSEIDVETELSPIGEALLQAWHFGDRTLLSDKQAHVYALRERGGFSRDETAEILNIAPSTVDTHLRRAKEKLAAAETLVRFARLDSDALAEVDPDAVTDSETSPDVTHLS